LLRILITLERIQRDRGTAVSGSAMG